MSGDSRKTYLDNVVRCSGNFTISFNDDSSDNIVDHLMILFLIFSILIISSNFLLIYGLYKTCRPFSITNELFVFLSIVDVLTVLISMSVNLTSFYFHNVPCFFYDIFNFTLTLFLHTGIATFDTISIMRYLSIKRPFDQITEDRKVYWIVFVEIVVITAYSIIIVLITNKITNVSSESSLKSSSESHHEKVSSS